MAKRDVVKLIRDFNAGRDPVRLAIKYRIIRDSPFAFLRGTAHLFWGDLPASAEIKAPAAWLCGDLHLENFGCYKGDNRLTYFDLNDFDEAALAPCALEPLRLLTSVILAAASGGSSEARARALCEIFLDAYQRQLACGKSRWIERETATGMIGELLQSVQRRDRKTFLDTRCSMRAGKRQLALRENKLFPASEEQTRRVKKFMREFASAQPNPRFFECLDVANRIAGTGSLGVDRYAILVEGHGSPDRNYLLDLKQALPSALAPYVKQRQPKWKTEAERVVTTQRRVQAISPAFLHAVELAGRPYVIRGLQPTADRLTLTKWQGKSRMLELALHNMGELVAWGQLRASGHSGSAIADELIEFAGGNAWKKRLLAAAADCARRVEKDWYCYGAAYDDGAFDLTPAKKAKRAKA
jgi:uncharacterized protein (DUF2252 family)